MARSVGRRGARGVRHAAPLRVDGGKEEATGPDRSSCRRTETMVALDRIWNYGCGWRMVNAPGLSQGGEVVKRSVLVPAQGP